VEEAARLIATEGPSALTLRRVAAAAGTSTMAIYTLFGGMPELRRAVRREGFARLAAHLETVEQSDDPVADLVLLGRAYYDNAITNAHLYRTMFMEQPLDPEADDLGWKATFDSLVTGVARCIESARFRPEDATAVATELWSIAHGVVTLQLASLMTRRRALEVLEGTTSKLFHAYGDDVRAVARSFDLARKRAATRG
jgi:AcrR family transcriptional regulator